MSGTSELKSAICAATEQHRGWRPLPSQVTVSCGAKHALFNLATALFEPGDEVVIPAPYWVSYPEQVRLVGATPVIADTTEEMGFRLTADALQAALSPRVKAIILCTPSNPTGSAYAEEHLLPLLGVLRRHDCWIIVDEIYADLTYDGFRHVSLPALAEDLASRVIVVDGVSKTFAMTGWRIGWSIAPTEVARALDVVQGQSTTNAAAVSSGGRCRRPERAPRRGVRDACSVRTAARADGRGAQRRTRGALQDAGGRVLRVRRRARALRARFPGDDARERRGRGDVDARSGARRRCRRHPFDAPWSSAPTGWRAGLSRRAPTSHRGGRRLPLSARMPSLRRCGRRPAVRSTWPRTGTDLLSGIASYDVLVRAASHRGSFQAVWS